MPVFKPADAVVIPTQARRVHPAPDEGAHEDLDAFTVRRAAGYMAGPQLRVFERLAREVPEGLFLNDIVHVMGEWTALATRAAEGAERRHLVLSDPYGYSPVFYALMPGKGLVVSDTFRGAVHGLDRHGIARTLDVDNYVAALSGIGPQYENSTSSRTMAREVSILPVTKALLVEGDLVALIDRPQDVTSAAQKLTFETLLEQGTSAALDAVRAATEYTSSQGILNLSGGVDSRLILAHLISAGATSHFAVRSHDPRTWHNESTRHVIERDVEIANTLREAHDLQWAGSAPRQGLSVSFMEYLHYFQSHSSNYHYGFKPSSAISGFSQPTAVLRGGGGELLRSTSGGRTFATAYEKEIGDAEGGGLEAQSEWVARRLTTSRSISAELRERAQGVLAESFRTADGESFEERMNDFYFAFRNRAHFGQGSRLRASNQLPIQILSNDHYRRAMRSLHFEQRAQGYGVGKLFEQLAPHLLDFPFESPEWTARLSRGTRGVSADRSWTAGYDAAASAPAPTEFLPGWERGARGERWQFFSADVLSNYVQTASRLLEELAGRDVGDVVEAVHAQVLPAARRQPRLLGRITANLASAIDVYVPVPLGGEVVGTGAPADSASPADHGRGLVPGMLAVPHDGWSNTDVLEYTSELHLSGDRILARTNAATSLGPAAEYAFYLRRDGDIIERAWYQERPYVEFEERLTPGVYSVLAFVRPTGPNGATIWKESSSLDLSGTSEA